MLAKLAVLDVTALAQALARLRMAAAAVHHGQPRLTLQGHPDSVGGALAPALPFRTQQHGKG